MKRLLVLVGSLLTLVLLLAGGIALVLTSHSFEIDVTPYKSHVTSFLGDRAGLDVRVDGNLRLKLGPTIGLRAQALHIRNPDRDGADELLSAETAALDLETAQLLSGRFSPTALELEQASVGIERDKDGRTGWETGSRAAAGSRSLLLMPDALGIRLRQVRLAYADRRSGASWSALIESADLTPSGEVSRVDLTGSIDGQPFRLKGTTATPSRLMVAKEPVPLDLSGELLGLSVRAKGKVANPWSGAEVAATLDVAGKSLAGLRPWLGEDLARQGPVKARLQLGGGGGSYRIAPFELAVGKGRFDGSLAADLTGKRPRLNLDLGVEEVDIRPFLSALGGDGVPSKPGAGGARELFPRDPVPTAWMDAADLDARVRVRNLVTPSFTVRDLDLDAKMASRRLRIDFAGKAEGGRSVTARLDLDGTADPLAVALNLKGDKLMLAPLVAATEARGMIRGDLDLSLEVRASGASPNGLMRSLDGKVLLLVEQAQADLTQIDRLTPGVRDLFGQLARPRTDLARVTCGVAAFEFSGGRTEVRGLVDTPDSTVVAHGNLDLGAETLEVRVVPDPKGVNLQVSAPVVIHGPLASPDFRVEKGGLLISLTELVSRVAVPQLLLVDAFGQAIAENPCVKLAAGNLDQRRTGPLGVVVKPVEGVVKGAGTLVKGTGEVIKGAGEAVLGGTGKVLKGVGGAVKGLLGGGRREEPTGNGGSPLDSGGRASP